MSMLNLCIVYPWYQFREMILVRISAFFQTLVRSLVQAGNVGLLLLPICYCLLVRLTSSLVFLFLLMHSPKTLMFASVGLLITSVMGDLGIRVRFMYTHCLGRPFPPPFRYIVLGWCLIRFLWIPTLFPKTILLPSSFWGLYSTLS